jgi:hypothetical protein
MAPVDKAELRRKERERKQKILLGVMLLVLALLLVWQGPKTLKKLKGHSSAAPAAQVASPATGSGTDTTATTPSTGSNGQGTAVAVSAHSLRDTDLAPQAGKDQLVSFSRFSARDPFTPLVDTNPTASAGETPPPASSGTSAPPPTTTTTPSYPIDTGGSTGVTTTPVQTGQVKLSVNGQVEEHVTGDVFPASDPTFEIVGVSTDGVTIGLASGSFSGGQQTITIKVGESVTLISQPDGARYTIKLLGIS